MKRPVNKKREKELIVNVILFFVGTFAIALLYKSNFFLTAFILLASIIVMKFWHKKGDIYFFIVGAIIGPVGEIIDIHFGAWQYSNPTFLGIPLWLPLTWGLGMVMIRRFAELLKDRN